MPKVNKYITADLFYSYDPAVAHGDTQVVTVFHKNADGTIEIVDERRFNARLNRWGRWMFWGLMAIIVELMVAWHWGII